MLTLLIRWKSLERPWTMLRQPCHSLNVEMQWSRAQWNPNLLTPCIQKQWSLLGKCCILAGKWGWERGVYVSSLITEKRMSTYTVSYQEPVFTSKSKNVRFCMAFLHPLLPFLSLWVRQAALITPNGCRKEAESEWDVTCPFLPARKWQSFHSFHPCTTLSIRFRLV